MFALIDVSNQMLEHNALQHQCVDVIANERVSVCALRADASSNMRAWRRAQRSWTRASILATHR